MTTTTPAVERRPTPKRPLWRRFLGLPRTKPGKIAAWLLALAVLWFAALQAVVQYGDQTGGEQFTDNLLLASMATAFFALIISAGAVATYAVLKRGERSVLDLVPMLLGLFWLIFLVGEIFGPE